MSTGATPPVADAPPGDPSKDATKAVSQQSSKRNRRASTDRSAAAAIPRPAKFEGKCDDLKGYIYDCADAKQADAYTKTTKEIAEYVGRTYKYGSDARRSIEKLTTVTIERPADPPDNAGRTDIRIWEKEVDEFVRRKSNLFENLKTIYSLVWGQCTEYMRQKIEATDDYEEMSEGFDSIMLLKTIKDIAYSFQGQNKDLAQALHEAKRRFYLIAQGRSATTQQYLEQFTNMVDVVEHSGGQVGIEPALESALAEERGKNVEDLTPQERVEAQSRYLGAAFILGADKTRFAKLIESLENDHLQSKGGWPKTLTTAYNLLVNWKGQQEHHPKGSSGSNDGVSFANVDGDEGTALNNNGQKRNIKTDKSKVTCSKCHKKGHYAPDCTEAAPLPANQQGSGGETSQQQASLPAPRQSAATLLLSGVRSGEFDNDHHVSFQFLTDGSNRATGLTLQGSAGHVPESWILLDNQSTVDVFANGSLLKNIRSVPGYMDIHCNAGVSSTNLMGDLPGYGPVWYNPKGIANILSLSRVQDRGYRITYDSDDGPVFTIHKADGSPPRRFHQSERGLFFLDTKDNPPNGTVMMLTSGDVENSTAVALVNTVASNKSKFTQREYSRALTARKLQQTIGRPSTKTFLSIVDGNMLPNCPITRKDVVNAEAIFGPDLGSLKGKTTRSKPIPVDSELSNVPPDIMKRYGNLTVSGDVMFVNKVAFFVTISRGIKFATVEMIKNQNSKTLLTAILQVKNIYAQRGFRLHDLLMDGQFSHLNNKLSKHGIHLNSVAHDEHVPEVERYIRVLKERARSAYNMLPFTRFPTRMIIELMYACNFWINCFPSADSASATLSPREIVTGMRVTYDKHCQLQFGDYVQTHESHDNTMLPRTTGAIALRPTGNEQGGHYFYSLTSGRMLNRNKWTVLPMPSDVVDRIHVLSRRSRATRDGLDIGDDIDRETENASHDESDDEDYMPPNHDELDDNSESDDASDNDTFDEDGGSDSGNDDDDDVSGASSEPTRVDYDDGYSTNEEDDEGSINEPDVTDTEDPPQDDDDASFDTRYGPRTSDHNLRPRKPRDYSHLHATLEHIAMTQMSMKRGIEEFGDDGIEAILKELQQLHDRDVLEPYPMSDLTYEDRSGALPYLMFLKKKRNGTVKGRGCADGRKQRLYTAKEDASSPTVATESVFLTCAVEAHEGRDVATVDLPGAFMQADMDDTVYMRIDGTMAELLIQIDPKKYGPCVQYIRGKAVLFVRLKKALYGTLKAALLFWKRLTSQLHTWGFETNPYDPCVANKIIDGTQCTIVWHVDDLKISHAKASVVTDIIELLKGEFGKEAPLTITRGRIHEYLGMTLDYTEPGKVKISMIDYVDTMLAQLPEDLSEGVAPTPASNHLFNVNENGVPLDTETSDLFHHNTAKLLFLCKRARPDLQTAIAFLCTRVKAPNTDDYKKLHRVMKYLRGTRNMVLTLEADNLQILKWWVDASFAVHRDMRSHTGGVLSMGRGAIYSTSTRQKLTTRSSTEGELVGVNDVMPQILWTRYFLESQGYPVSDAIIYQDNQSSILLENNGKASSGKRTRHINIRYFFVTDRVASKEVRIDYCPTGEMLADFFTKPLQGTPFRKFRDIIMNLAPTSYSLPEHRSVLGIDDGNENDDPGWTLVTTSKKRKPMKSKRSFKASKVCTGYTSSSEMRSYDREQIHSG